MGLFSFLKNAGAKLFNKKETKSAETTTTTKSSEELNEALDQQKALLLKGIVEGLGLSVEGLDITVDDETVIVYGEAASHAEREKIILALGNVEGIATVDDRMTVKVVEMVEEESSQFYEVQKGDTLSKIAKEYYGNAMKYPVIFEANKPMLKDPDLIYPGQVLRIPPLKA
ncbi:MAG TPA: peptidoglycan-binding protein LysM [Saprospiraceae bacterium]|nr:peptidoglycan-binding protein LysM [Saprospiraceae bacterium]HMQ84379.1 peptidoglycan-binding protein LysM [Saprospiraceae bacterium]